MENNLKTKELSFYYKSENGQDWAANNIYDKYIVVGLLLVSLSLI